MSDEIRYDVDGDGIEEIYASAEELQAAKDMWANRRNLRETTANQVGFERDHYSESVRFIFLETQTRWQKARPLMQLFFRLLFHGRVA